MRASPDKAYAWSDFGRAPRQLAFGFGRLPSPDCRFEALMPRVRLRGTAAVFGGHKFVT